LASHHTLDRDIFVTLDDRAGLLAFPESPRWRANSFRCVILRPATLSKKI